MTVIVLSLVFCGVMLATGYLRWKMAQLYWHTHVGGSDGYRRDCLLLSTPLFFLAIGGALGLPLSMSYGVAVYIFILPIALSFAIALALSPPLKRASIRIMRARYPVEPA